MEATLHCVQLRVVGFEPDLPAARIGFDQDGDVLCGVLAVVAPVEVEPQLMT